MTALRGHVLHVTKVKLSTGAEIVVVQCGDMMTMPGPAQNIRNTARVHREQNHFRYARQPGGVRRDQAGGGQTGGGVGAGSRGWA